MSSLPIYTGLEYVGLALIFLPEPTTTFIGVGLLGYARSKKMGQEPQLVYRRAYFSDIYSYNLKMKDGAAIHYHVTGIREGQMPRKWPVACKPHTADHLRESHLKTKNNVIHALPPRKPLTGSREGLLASRIVHTQPTRKQFSGLQEGLLNNRAAGAGYARSVAARRSPRPKWAT
ncbi:MAG: hypothetical protein FJZ94_01415 [Chloroflexi bacterium]|nr:hypothetical protein [Chloroflexota bacterium]MBM4451893.1 hypothetical protein [Chloroflexota bacterium]MBM4453344.1 hypothetical protein [Chloroflexota bacterium]